MSARKYTDQQLLDICEAALRDHGPHITIYQFCQITGVYEGHLQKRFGGWNAVKARLGFGPEEIHRPGRILYSRDFLIQRTRDLARELGDDLTFTELSRRTGVSIQPVRKQCGSWSELRLLAGLVKNTRGKNRIPNDALLADIHRLWQQFKREPTSLEYERFGCAHISTMCRRFGPTWGHALNAYYKFLYRFRREFPDPAAAQKRWNDLAYALLRPRKITPHGFGWPADPSLPAHNSSAAPCGPPGGATASAMNGTPSP